MKYKYDIKIIEELANNGLSTREIARKNNWGEISTQQWINRHYKRTIKYIKKIVREGV
jgi:transposase